MARVCNGSQLPARRPEQGRICCAPSAAPATRSGTSPIPTKPARVTVVVSGLRDTHKSFWECDTGIALPRLGRPRMAHAADDEDLRPEQSRQAGLHPRLRRLPGQQPGSTGPVPTELHGPISLGPKGNRVYFAHGTGTRGIVQIVDREKLLNGPKEPTEANLRYPRSRGSIFRRTRARTRRCRCSACSCRSSPKQRPPPNAPQPGVGSRAWRHHSAATTQVAPRLHRRRSARPPATSAWSRGRWCGCSTSPTSRTRLASSTWTVPEASGNFCERGGRFGAHSSHENPTPIYYGRVLFVTYFNAGVRALDIRDPIQPEGDRVSTFRRSPTRPTSAASARAPQRAVQDRDSDQQRRSRRPRLHLHRRPREHGPAHPRADRSGAPGRKLPRAEHRAEVIKSQITSHKSQSSNPL